MSVYDIKPKFQTLIRPLCRRFAAAGLTANQVTMAAAALSIAHGLALASQPGNAVWLILLPVTLFIRMALNAIDGMLAREHNQKSRLGAMLNEVCDVVSDAALYLPFALIPGLSPHAAVLIVVLSGLAELTGVVALSIGSSRRYEGPMGKSDRALAFGLFALLLAFDWISGGWAQGYQWIVFALIGCTIVNRARKALDERK
ncbi:MAG: CDP-alcohol phosphatidyltransferase family protein [Dongiaceae bacterium]